MITYLYFKEDEFDDMPLGLTFMVLPLMILLDILFIPFQLIFYLIYVKRCRDDNSSNNI